MITISLKNGVKKEYEAGVTVYDIAKDLGDGLTKAACAAEIDGVVHDLRDAVNCDAAINILTFDDEAGKRALRHTASHVLAQAVKRLYPKTLLAIGPAIDDGFYYDFDPEKPFTGEDLFNIENEMKKIIKEELPVERFSMTREEAVKYFDGLGEIYKSELAAGLPDGVAATFYKQGEFTDLCAGPHLMNVKYIKAVKLTNEAGSSGAYWRGDEKNKSLARVYGTAYTKASDLEDYLKKREEAKKNDHNKLGRELGYFTTSDIVGQGLPLLMPKGAKIVQLLQRFVEDEEERRGYLLTKTPAMAKSELFKISGHWDKYRDGMFFWGDESKGEEVLTLRPVTCPHQFTIYNAEQHSYRDLPIRYDETSTLYRKEASGEMHGLIRVRQFTLSEGHIVCMREQLEDEFKRAVDLQSFMMCTLGIENDVTYRFSKWDPNHKEKYLGDEAVWEETQEIMRRLLNEIGLKFTEAEGEAAIYGPKLDIQFKNVFGKEDTAITLQIDYTLAERFGMTYIDKDGSKKRPIIIHRSSVGSYERIFAFLIEKYAGAFPTWLSPIQAAVLPISDKYNDYAQSVADSLRQSGVRVRLDDRSEKIGYKIREARNDRTPYILVVGEKEMTNGEVSVRSRANGDEGSFPVGEFFRRILNEIETKDRSAVNAYAE